MQTYINRHVPITHQGRTFALQGALRNGTAIVPLLTLGIAAGEFGADKVLLFSPLVLLVVAYGLVVASFRISGIEAPTRLQVMESFWDEPDVASVSKLRPPGPASRGAGPGGLVGSSGCVLAVDARTAPLRAAGPVQAIGRVRPAPALQADQFGLAVHLFSGHVAAAARASFELHHLLCSFPDWLLSQFDYSSVD